MLIERILSRREELANERLVDHGHVLARLVVGVGEMTAAYELHSKLPQVVGGDAIPRRAGLRARRRWRLARDENALAPVVRQRVVERESRRLHAGNAGESRFDV